MACPAFQHLRDVQEGNREDPEIQAHVEGCPECRMDLFLLRELGPALRPDVEVPENLIARVMAGLDSAKGASPGPADLPLPQLVLTGILGATTAVLALGVSGTFNQEDPLQPLALILLVAGLSVVASRRVESGPPPAGG